MAFAVAVVLKFAAYGYIYLLAQRSDAKGSVAVSEKGMDGKDTKKTMTVQEYDAAQVVKSVGQAAFGLCITCGIHYKWSNPTPLLFQCLMGPLGLFDDALFKIHVMGAKAEGKLARPFKAAASPFAELLGGGAAADAASDAPAEKKRGKKDKAAKVD